MTQDEVGRSGMRGVPARIESRLASWPSWAMPAAVFAVAFAVRAWTLADERAANPLFRSPLLDDAMYLRLADDVRTGASAGRPWFLAPLYPWVLAAFSRGSAPDMETAERLSTLLGAGTAAVAALAARVLHSHLAGWLAGALCALCGALVFHDVLPGQEPLLCLLHATALLLVAVYLKRREGTYKQVPMNSSAAALGVVAGAAVLGRSVSASLVAAFVVVAAAHVRPTRRAAYGVAIALAGAAAVLLPAALRNASATGDFTPLPWSGGPNLYLANGPESRRTMNYAAKELGVEPEAMERLAVETAEKERGRKLRPSEVSAYWTDRAWAEAGAPGELSAHLAKKAVLFWSRDDVGSNHDASIDREWAGWLRVAPVSSWWLLALGVAGWIVARRSSPALDYAAVVLVLTWAALTVVYPLARYKLPLLPLAAACAAAGAAEAALRGVSWRRLAVAALVLVAATRASAERLREPDPTWSLTNLVYAFEREGRRPEAIGMARRLVERSPADGWALERLGRLLLDEGRAQEAVPPLQRAKEDPRTSGSAAVALVYAYVAVGEPARAEAEGLELGDAAGAGPEIRAELFSNLALAAAARGDAGLASRRLDAAASISPDAPAVRRAKKSLAK